MKFKLFAVLALLCAPPLWGQTAINLSGSSVSCNAGLVEVGENAVCGVYNITNNTGAPFTVYATPFVAQAYPFVWSSTATYGASYTVIAGGHWYDSLIYSNLNNPPATSPSAWHDDGTAIKYVTVAMDGDARARIWGESFEPNAPSSGMYSPYAYTMAAGATGQLTVYVAPHASGSVTGHVYLVDASGNILSTITASATGTTVPLSGGAAAPAAFNESYTRAGSCSTTTSCSLASVNAAISSAACGQTICIPAGCTISGNVTLPGISGCATDTTLTTANYASIPAAGTRINPATDASNMATIQDTSGNPAITFAWPNHYWRVLGLKLTSTAPASFLVASPGVLTMQPSADLPVHDVLDHVWLTTSGTTGGFGAEMDGSFAVVDSYIDLAGTTETQGINTCSSNGPILVRNNYVKAVGENLLFGGCDSRVLGAVPQDATITSNYFYKPLTWDSHDASYDGISRAVKNLLEFKKCVRCKVEGNVFQNNFISAQDGSAILMEPANQSGSDLDVSVRDITFQYNYVHGAWNAFNHVSSSYAWPSRTSKHWTIQHNVFDHIGDSRYGVGSSYCITNWSAGASSWFFRWQSNPTPDSDVWFSHNDCFGDSVSGFIAYSGVSSTQVNGFNLKNNLVSHGIYGLFINGTTGTTNEGIVWTSADTTNNVMIGTNPGTYDASFIFASDTTAVGFTNYAGGNYQLTTGSIYHNAATDGTDFGADIATLNTKTACAVSGACAAPPPPLTLVSCTVAPSSSTISVAAGQSYAVTGTYSDSSTADITSASTFTSSNTSVATTSGNTATGVSAGSSTITATDGSVSCTSSLTVNAPSGGGKNSRHGKGGGRFK